MEMIKENNRFAQLVEALERGWEIQEPVMLGTLWQTTTGGSTGAYHFVLRHQAGIAAFAHHVDHLLIISPCKSYGHRNHGPLLVPLRLFGNMVQAAFRFLRISGKSVNLRQRDPVAVLLLP